MMLNEIYENHTNVTRYIAKIRGTLRTCYFAREKKKLRQNLMRWSGVFSGSLKIKELNSFGSQYINNGGRICDTPQGKERKGIRRNWLVIRFFGNISANPFTLNLQGLTLITHPLRLEPHHHHI
jgi:hypothetical protein